MKVLTCLSLCGLLAIVGCSKDKNLKDYNQEQAQQIISRITAVSGSYSGPANSNLADNASLGSVTLNFKAQSYVQSSSNQGQQTVNVSGSLGLKSLTSAEIVFTNGTYTYDETNRGRDMLQVFIPVTIGNKQSSLKLEGSIDGDQFSGSVEVEGYPAYGATLNLVKNAPMPTTSAIEVGGTRLQQINKMDYTYSERHIENRGKDEIIEYYVKMKFKDLDILPAQKFYKIFSPLRTVSIDFGITGFVYTFENAIINDEAGTITTPNETLTCKKFDEPNGNFGWDCITVINGKDRRHHLAALR